jgi:hypothetical protein
VNTDADGKFLFRELRPGRYELAACFNGFLPFQSAIVVNQSTNAAANL